jgi:hypothetical protein
MTWWLRRHPALTWTLAWGLTGSGLFIADVWSDPRRGPLWVGMAVGLAAWGLAGGTTFRFDRFRTGFVVWAGAYGLTVWLASSWGTWFERNQVGPMSSAGFVGMLFAWAVGAGCGAFATAVLATPKRRLFRSFAFATAWGLSFLVAGFAGMVAGMVLGELSKVVLEFLGSPFLALAIGWGVGGALGGLLASVCGFAAWRTLFGPVSQSGV